MEITCVTSRDGKKLPITAKPYKEILDHLGMSEFEYRQAIGSLIKNKVVRVKNEN